MTRDDAGDKKLMEKVVRGDHEAFEELVLRHQASVFGLAYRYLGERSEAEDVAQETFVRLMGAASRYRPEAQFRTYLLKITTNLCLNRRARSYRRLEERLDPSDARLSNQRTSEPDPEQALLRSEQVQAVRGAVLALPEDQRIALILFRFHGMSYDQVAEVMDKSPSAVTSLLWRARQRLRRELQSWVEGGAVSQDLEDASVNECRKAR